jgi:hypothetical protein
MKRLKNKLGDYIIEGKLTIKELYELAVTEGMEDRTLHFSIKNSKTKQHFSTSKVADFGKGWTKGTMIMHLEWESEEDIPESSIKIERTPGKSDM